MAQSSTARVVGLGRNDPLFTRLRAEAEEAAQRDPALASFLMTAILNHDTFEHAVVNRVAERLDHRNVPGALIRQAYDEALSRDSSLGDAFRADLMAVCEASQVPCGPVYAIDEIFEDPHYAARGNILRMQDPRVGELAVPNLVPRLSATPGKVNWLGMELGAHNDEIYRGVLGLDEAELRRLKDAAVI